LQAEFEPSLTEFSTIYGKGILVYKFEDFNGNTIENVNPKSLVMFLKGGIINGKAIKLPKPVYPKKAKDSCAGGTVEVAVLVYPQTGKVISAEAISGNELLRESAEKAASNAEFVASSTHGTENLYVKGILVYNFEPFVECADAKESEKRIVVGNFNSNAVRIVKPKYPKLAKKLNIKGKVSVNIVIDKEGNVESAKAFEGHSLLRAEAENAAKKSKFRPTNLSGKIVKVKSVIVYYFY
jgi:TonB family protein